MLAAILLIPICGVASTTTAVSVKDDLDLSQRRALTRGADLTAPANSATAQQAQELAAAMGLPPDWIRHIEIDAHSQQVDSVKQLGIITPIQGNAMAVLSTGTTDTHAARPGIGAAHRNTKNSGAVRLRLVLEPPAGGRQLSFRYRFLTGEYPEFSAAGFRDEFSMSVTDALGTRSLLRIDSDDPTIAPVSSDNAAGTGFDLFDDHAGRMQGAFDHGMPRGGITNWQRISSPIAQDGPLTLEFVLRDHGDGLVDSTVLLDSLNLKAVELERLDVNQLAGLPQVLQCLNQGGTVSGAVADGETALYYRFYNLPAPGNVTFSFQSGGSAPLDGGFDQPGGTQRLNSITVRTTPSPLGGLEGLAGYLVPEEFNRGGNENSANRTVYLAAHYVPDNPGLPSDSVVSALQLWRPPVVLVHGLWSSIEAWNESPLHGDPRLRTFRANYKSTNAARFATNRMAPAGAILDACHSMWNSGAAMSQVDYVGHSMGGLLGRNLDRIHPGLINKFFTVNSPHTGSPLGNLVVAFRQSLLPAHRNLVLSILRTIGHPIDQGALDDLSLGSTAIGQIQATTIPSHALVGVGGSDLTGALLANAPDPMGTFYRALDFLFDLDTLLQGLQHDLIVGRGSQIGGISGSAHTVFNGLHSIHTSATKSSQYRDRIVQLLNTPATSASFGSFPPPASVAFDDAVSSISDHFSPMDYSAHRIQIVQPSPGMSYAPGDTIPVTLAPVAGFSLDRAMLLSAVGSSTLNAPFTGALTIPSNHLGPLELIALGRNNAGTITYSQPVNVIVSTHLAITSIAISPRNQYLYDHADRRQLQVMARFSDGIDRDITHSSTGTVYSSANPAIAQVDANGLISPIGGGVTTILASNGGRQDSITVTVNPIEPIIFANGFDP